MKLMDGLNLEAIVNETSGRELIAKVEKINGLGE
jgi:hypothetical protein